MAKNILKFIQPGHLLASTLVGAAAGSGTAGLINSKYIKGGAATGAALGALSSLVHTTLAGTPSTDYDVDPLSVNKADDNDAIIYLSGGGGGDWQGDANFDTIAMDKYFGRGKYKIFSHSDVDLAMNYLYNLPKDVRVNIIGHSMGGPAAYLLAQAANKVGKPVNTLITLDPVGRFLNSPRIGDKPENVKRWINYYPAKRNFSAPGDYLAVLGGAYNKIDGATNRSIRGKNANHAAVRASMMEGLKKEIENG